MSLVPQVSTIIPTEYNSPEAKKIRDIQTTKSWVAPKEFVPGELWMKPKKITWNEDCPIEGRIYYTDKNLHKPTSHVRNVDPEGSVPFPFPKDHVVVSDDGGGTCACAPIVDVLSDLRAQYEEDYKALDAAILSRGNSMYERILDDNNL
jgi:hypothetical protein